MLANPPCHPTHSLKTPTQITNSKTSISLDVSSPLFNVPVHILESAEISLHTKMTYHAIAVSNLADIIVGTIRSELSLQFLVKIELLEILDEKH